MNKLGLRNVILVSLSAALLNLSFVLAQPAQPPANGALTPNFTGLNVSGTSETSNLKVDTLTSKTVADPININDTLVIDGNLDANNNTFLETTYISGELNMVEGAGNVYFNNSWMQVNDLSAFGETLLRDTSVNGTLKTDTIQERVTNNGILLNGKNITANGTLKTNIIEERTTNNGILLNDKTTVKGNLKVNKIQERTGVGITLDDNTTVNGTLTVNTIEEKTNNNGTRFNNDIIVSGAVNGQSVGAATGSFGTLEVGGSSLIQFIGSKFYPRSSTGTSDADRTVSCLEGDILVNCGAYSGSTRNLKKIYTYSPRGSGPFGADTHCRVVFSARGYNQKADAICLDL